MTASVARSVAVALVDAVNRGSVDDVLALLSSDAVYWNNVTHTDAARDALATQLRIDFELFGDFRYADVHVNVTDEGFMLRMQAQVQARNGKSAAFPVCVVGRIEEGLIVRLEDWADPTPVVRLLGAGNRRPDRQNVGLL
jgi:ketosteroid isomerase-like protein